MTWNQIGYETFALVEKDGEIVNEIRRGHNFVWTVRSDQKEYLTKAQAMNHANTLAGFVGKSMEKTA
jgi:hypothetical protein